MKYNSQTDKYEPIEWEEAFEQIGTRLQSYSDPNTVEFYTSGRTSNEAAFLYQLLAREYGTNNFPDCSNIAMSQRVLVLLTLLVSVRRRYY